MHQRTRTLVPVLPRLITAAEQNLGWTTRLLEATRYTLPGDKLSVDGVGGNASSWRSPAARKATH